MAAQDLTATSISKSGTNDDNVIFNSGESEVERLDFQHQVIYDANPQLVWAPIDLTKGGHKILDQATGSGIWIRDLRKDVAAQTWVGTDIEDNYFPTSPPPDTTYHHQSMTEPWPVDSNGTFDLVHSRAALPGVGTTPIANAVNGLIGLVKPGGWIQLVEMEWDDWNVGPKGAIFHDAIKEMISMVSNGQGVDMREKLILLLKDAGLENIDYHIFTTPFGARASDKIRSKSEASLFATATGVSMTTKNLPPISISREQLDTMPQELLEEMKEMGFEFKMFALWAQKPLSK